MKKTNRLMATLLAVLMLLQCVSFAAPTEANAAATASNEQITTEQFVDFPDDWSTPAMTAAVKNGLLVGTSDTTIEPKKNLTRAEMAAIISRAFGATVPADISAVQDVTPEDWFYSPVALSYQMEVFQGVSENSFLPRDFIRREDMFLALARVLVLEDGDGAELRAFSDGKDVDTWAVGAMDAMVRDDYLDGYEDKTLRPRRNITRAEVAQVFYNIIDTYISQPGSYTDADLKGTVLVRSKDVFIHDAVIEGDLIVADGVGDGDFDMENVHVTGRILFRGGEGTVTFKNVTADGKVIIHDVNGTVNFHNYRTDSPFKDNIVEHTPATFLVPKDPDKTPSGPSSGPGGTGVTSKVKVTTEFYFQNLDGTYPTEPTIDSTKSVSKYASTKAETNTDLSKLVDNDTITQAQYDEWVNGFEWDETFAEEDNSTVITAATTLERHYKRKSITVTVKDAFGDDAVPPTVDVLYGATLPDPVSTPDDYVFDGWTTEKGSEEDKLADDYEVTEPITIYPIFKPENDNYTSKYYFQELDGTTYTEDTSLSYSDKAILGATVTAEDKSKTGFTLDETHPDTLREGTVVVTPELELKSFYKRNTHKMSVEINGNEVYSIDDVMFGDSVDNTLFPQPGIDDYNPATQKLYWTIKGQSDSIIDFTTFTMPDEPVVFVPKVETNDKAQYKVIWYTQKANLSGYDELDSDNRLGVIGATVAVTDEDKTAPDGFVLVDGAPSVFSGTVVDDTDPSDILVLEIYFNRETYRVSFKNEDGTEFDYEEVAFGGTITKNPTLPDGFKKQFAGWSTVEDDHTKIVSDLSTLDVTQPIDLYPIFKYQYTFRYWHESMSNPGNYNWQNEADVDGWGFAGETKYAPAYTAPVGYHLSTVEENETELTIVKDGVNVAQSFYDLNRHKLSVEIDGNEVYSIDDVTFGAKVDETLFPEPDYDPETQDFYWVIKGQPDSIIDFATFTMPDEPVVFVPKVETNDKAQYKVIWYTQKVDLSGYDEYDTDNRLGVIGATVAVTDEDKTAPDGFVLVDGAPSVFSGTVVDDTDPSDILVLEIYFNRETYRVSFKNEDGTEFDYEEVAFGGTITKNPTLPDGFKKQFAGWSTVEDDHTKIVSDLSTLDVTQPIDLYPIFKYQYTFRYWHESMSNPGNYNWQNEADVDGWGFAGETKYAPAYTAPTGYHLSTVKENETELTIVKDGVNVAQSFYDLDVYTISFMNEDGKTPAVYATEDVKYGGKITTNANLTLTTTVPGKSFAGWTTVKGDKDTLVADLTTVDITTVDTLYPIFKFEYTIKYYKQNEQDDNYTELTDLEVNATDYEGVTIVPTLSPDSGYAVNVDKSDEEGAVLNSKLTLEIYYDRADYTVVSFMGEDGSVFTTENVMQGEFITVNKDLALTTEVEGKSFAGWTTTKGDAATLVDLGTVDVTVYNTFYPIFKFEYTIKYYKQNEQDDNYTELTDLEVNATDYEGVTIVPTLSPDQGYAVNTEKSDEEGAVLNSKLTLEIYYDRADYTYVRFMNEDGKQPIVYASENVRNGEFITINKDLTLTTDVEGKSFAGWTTTKGDATTLVADLGTVDVTVYNTFYPIFKFEYTIKYYTQNLDDDNYTESSASDTDYEGVTIVPNVTVPEGFVLNAEKSDEEGAVLNSKLTLEIYYDRIKYTVNFMNEDGKEPAVYATEQVKHGGKITENKDLTLTTEVEGKSFAGWTTVKGDANTIVSDLTTVDVTKVDTLYPIFKFEYTIKYYTQNVDDDNYTELTALQVNGSDYEGVTITPTVSAPEGFALNAEKSDEEGVVLDSKEIIEVYYDRVLHTVKFYNEKSEELDTITVKHGGKITQTPTVPAEIAGIPFRGWSTDGTLQRVLDLDTYTVTEGDETNPVKLYAVYDDSDITYTVTFKVDGETYGNVQTVASSGYATVPADPEKTNFSFLYWYLEGDAQQTQVDVANYVILENTVFVAKFDEVFATVRFFNPAKPAASQLIKTIDTYHIGDTIVEADFPAKRRDKNGYNIDSTSSLYSGVYTEDYQHKITSQWLYKDEDGKWQIFKPDETPIPESGTLDLWNYFMVARFSLDSSKMPESLILDAYYEEDTRAAVSVKDAIFGGETQIKNILSIMGIEEKIYSKLAEKGLVEAGSNEIMNVNKQVNFVTVAGEEFVNNFLDEQLGVNVSMSNQELLDKYGVVFLQSENTINMFFGDKYYQDAVYSWYKETVYDEFLINEAHSESFANILLEYDEAKLMVFDKFAPQEVLDLGLSNEQKLQYINDNIDDFKTPELINKIEHDPEVKALVLDENGEIGKAIKEKVFGDYADELKEYLKEYIKNHAEELIRDHGMEIIEANPALADEYKAAHEEEIQEALKLLKWELANKDQFTVNEDTVMIVMALEEYLLEMRDFNDFKAEYLSRIPDSLFEQLPMDEVILPLYNRTLEAYLAQVIGALEKADQGIYGADNMVDSGVTLRFNPISEVYIPMQKWAMENYDALADKLSGRDHAVIDKYMQYYDANPYNHALVKLSNPENYFNGTARDYTEKFSGYSLKGYDDLYEMIKAGAVLVDDTFLWYCENVAPEDVEMVLDKFEERVLHYVNYTVGLAETFAEDGIPGSLQELVNEIMIDDMLKNDIIKVGDKVTDKDVLEYIDKLAANSTANGAYDKLSDKFAARLQVVLQKFSESKFNKTYTEEDYERGKEILNKIHVDNNAQITTDFIFEDVLKADSKTFTFRELVEVILERAQG